MQLLTIIVIAIALSADTFAISVVSGATYRQLRFAYAVRMAGLFGGFQALMPIAGSLAGAAFRTYIAGFDHWIAFGLLTIIGVKMIVESFKIGQVEKRHDPTNFTVVLILAIATSIDALAVGVTLSLITPHILPAAVLIGLITFGISLAGVLIGKKLGHFLEIKLEALGGLVLIAIGLKILIEHLAA